MDYQDNLSQKEKPKWGSGRGGNRVYVGVIRTKVAPTSKIYFDVCNSQNHCVKGGSVATSAYGAAFLPNSYVALPHEVTSIFKKEPGFDEKAYARITSADDPRALSGLQPIMMWRKMSRKLKNTLLPEKTVYLAEGVSKNAYGTLLHKYDHVVENKAH